MTRQTRNYALILILVLTASLWAGAIGVGLNSDDYQYIPSLAPITHVGDIFRPFVEPDANPSYFRPVANATMALDFLLFGWSGAGFHLTNLLLHLVATLLVFYFARDVLGLREKESLVTALVFGLMASHEYNLVVATARADILAGIFIMLTLIWFGRGRNILSLIWFSLALLSKEIAVLVLPFLPLLLVKRGMKATEWPRRLRVLVPYLLIFIAFYFYRAQFTVPVFASAPIAAGAHSVFGLLLNAAYSLGYLVLPVGLDQSVVILRHYRTPVLLAVSFFILLFGWVVVRGLDRNSFQPLVRSLSFSLLMGSVLFLIFGRWRLYVPSIGLIAVAVLAVNRIFSVRARRIALLLLILLGVRVRHCGMGYEKI